ncbi:hypothetical protein, partial [Actinomadura roseirufa]|uniref:hypothetical protein n=1 Tax=Actinomadura roseirufa TaxID=2094049 RepID=UPI001A954450
DEAREALRTLAGAGLAEDAGGGRYRVPEAVCGAVPGQAGERDAAMRRLLDGYLAGEPVAAEALALLDRERWTEAAETLTAALRDAERDAERTGDRRAVLLARHDLGRALTGTGDLDRALELLGPLPDAFATLPEPDPMRRGAALTSLGLVQLRMRRPVTAINFFGQALELMRAEGAVERQGDLFVALADAARQRGDGAAEGAALDRAAELYEAVPSPRAGSVSDRRAALGH